ncbi:MAG: hypothetical protein H0V50_05905, partial [Thermoleophilaceae bacterium]|nr:hypothetical protein [Thermoleophilaceae bacterium]
MSEQNFKSVKPRTPPWILGSIVLTLLTTLVVLQSSNLWKSFSIETASDTLTLYGLLSLNFIAFIIFASIFIRSILKLVRERRALALGSRIKTRLLIYFVAVSILPIIAMAIFSYLFMNRALERWFERIPENVIRETRQMQAQSIESEIIKLDETTRMLVKLLEAQNAGSEKLTEVVEQGNLTRLEILSPEGEILAESEKPLSGEQKRELEKTLGFVRQNKFSEPVLTDRKGFDIA